MPSGVRDITKVHCMQGKNTLTVQSEGPLNFLIFNF